MAMVCPQCSTVYEQQERVCSSCSVQLLFYARMSPTTSVAAADEDAAQWQQTALGRIVVGLILSQGLALGLKQLLTAGFQANGDAVATSLWDTITGLALLHSLHALGLLVGGALAGASQARGVLYGAIAGLGSGMLFLVMQPQVVQLLTPVSHFCQPLLHVMFGALGGWIGRAIWQPTPCLVMPEAKSANSAPSLLEMRWLHGPIAWPRVIAGAILAACGVAWSNMIMTWMINASQGSLTLTTHFQAKLVSWEIAGLTMLLGACFAGATTWNGLKQGLCVAIGGTVLYAGYQLASPKFDLETVVFAVVSMFGVGLGGGWFGAQLFPPLGRRRRRQRILEI